MTNWQQQSIELWGERWKAILAKTAGVTKRTVQYWCAGRYQIKDDIVKKINETHDIWRKSDEK